LRAVVELAGIAIPFGLLSTDNRRASFVKAALATGIAASRCITAAIPTVRVVDRATAVANAVLVIVDMTAPIRGHPGCVGFLLRVPFRVQFQGQIRTHIDSIGILYPCFDRRIISRLIGVNRCILSSGIRVNLNIGVRTGV